MSSKAKSSRAKKPAGREQQSRTIYRVASRHKPFAQLGNSMLRDERLAFDERGVLAFILSYPEDWQFKEGWLCDKGDIGRDKARRIILKLIECGYCKRRRLRNADGTLGAAEYLFTDEPHLLADPDDPGQPAPANDGKPDVGSPVNGNPTLAEPQQTNTIEDEHCDEHQGESAQALPAPEAHGVVVDAEFIDVEHAEPEQPTKNQPQTLVALKASKAPTPAKATAHRLPEDWMPSEDGWRFALEWLGSTERAREEFAKFRDYWDELPDSKGKKVRWDGTWRNWVRRAPQYAPRTPARSTGRVDRSQLCT